MKKQTLAAGAAALILVAVAAGVVAGVALPGKFRASDMTAKAAVLASATSRSSASKPQPLHSCSRSTMRQLQLQGWLEIGGRSNCVGAGLMAGDLYYDATQRFPRPLPES